MNPVVPTARSRRATRLPLRFATLALLIASSLLAAQAVRAQGPAPVRYTEARRTDLRDTVRLPGNVAADVQSLLATEVAGLVVELPAREGARVERGDVIARLRTDQLELQLEAARGQRTEAQARLDRAENQLDRARGLIESDAISPDQFDDAYSEYSAWQGRLQRLEAEIARIELDIERCTIESLVGGVVVDERTEVGEWIGVGAPVVEVVALDQLEIRVDVPERFFGALRRGTAVEVSFEALPDLIERATLTAIIPRANAQARTFPIQLTLRDPDPRIGIGMLASVQMPVGEARRAVVVPKDAVVSSAQGRAVWVIGEDDTVRNVPVKIGDAVGAWISVRGEIEPGDRVVVRGNERLRPQQSVRGEVLEYELP